MLTLRVVSWPYVSVLAILVAAGVGGLAAGEEPAADAAQRELHVVSIYEGYYRTGNMIHGGRATVSVSRPGRLVTLVLLTYEPVTWQVSVDEQTRIERVFLGGAQQQAVKGLAEGIEVADAHTADAEVRLPYFGYRVDSEGFRPFVEQMRKLTDLEIASFHGEYAAAHPIDVNEVESDPRLAADYPQPTPLDELPELRFPAIHYAQRQHRHDYHASFGEFTLAGPDNDSLRPLPKRVNRLVYDPAGEKYYGISGHAVVEVDLENQTTAELDPGLDVPPLSWPSDVSFDTKRQRLLLTTSGGGGYLYSYVPATGEWSVLVEKLGTDAFTYHPEHDALYGVGFEYDGEGHRPVFREFNADGALIRSQPLGEPVVRGLPTGPGVCGLQVVSAGDKVVILASPFGVRSEMDGAGKSYIYLIDPKSDEIWLTWKSE